LRRAKENGTGAGKSLVPRETCTNGALIMWTLVNASYGIAMGQRPTGVVETGRGMTPDIDGSTRERSPRPNSIPMRWARSCLRAFATVTAGIGRHRALAGINTGSRYAKMRAD
jgi:hypothetical protein